MGDRLPTASGAVRPVIWTGWRRVDCARHPYPEHVWPVRVVAGTFGDRMPLRDLDLSPEHAVFLDGVLTPIGELINGRSVQQMQVQSVAYHHIELDRHDVILAEGMPVESFMENGNRNDMEGGLVLTLHPTPRGSGPDCAPCARVVRQGVELERVREWMSVRGDKGRGLDAA